MSDDENSQPPSNEGATNAESTSGGWEVAESDPVGEGTSDNSEANVSGEEQSSDEQHSEQGDSDQMETLISDVVDEEFKSDDEHERVEEDTQPGYCRELEKDYGSEVDKEYSPRSLATPAVQAPSREYRGIPATSGAQRDRIKRALSEFMQNERKKDREAADVVINPRKRTKNVYYGDPGRFVKPEPFASGVAHDIRWSTWIDWKVQFEAALSVSGELSEHQKANHLFLSVGGELRQIVNAYGLKPEPSQVPLDYPFYEKLVEGLDKHFEGTSDATVDIKNLMSMVQKEGEPVREFHVRLMLQARVCFKKSFATGDYSGLLRDRLVGGLRDKEIANMAFLNEWGIEKVVEVASRGETLQLNKKALVEQKPIVEVFEIDSDDPPNVAATRRSDSASGTQRFARSRNERSNFGRPSRDGGDGRDPCKNCGLVRHRPSLGCPAIGKPCRNCKRLGHFAVVCKDRRGGRREVNEVPAFAKQENAADEVIHE